MEYELTNIIYDNSEYELEIENENIEIQDVSLEELTVLPSSEQQIITPTQPKTYYNKVIVEPVVTEDIVTQSSNKDKLIIPLVGTFFNRVWVKGDSNLVSENIKEGVTILGVDGSLNTKYSPSFISFYYYKGTDLTEELSNLDTSKLTSMKYMFGYTDLVDLDLSNFNTENVESMEQMFHYSKKLETLNLSNFNTEKVTNMDSMFYSCLLLKELDLSSFNTSNVTDMYNMFGKCESLTKLDLSTFNTSNVTNMSQMFDDCTNLTEVDLSSFNTEKVTSMGSMFNSCSSLIKVDISSFTSEKSPYNAGMFMSCTSLTTLIINNPNLFRMNDSNMLRNTPIANGTGYVYVPDDMVETYKSATNWNIYANQIKGMSELPEGV